MQKTILEKNSSSALAVYLVWTPVQPADNQLAAFEARALMPDARVRHYWDNNRMLAQNYRRILPAGPTCQTVWDVFMLYSAGVKWGEFTPPFPNFWMHQLSCMNTAGNFNVKDLREAIEKGLARQ